MNNPAPLAQLRESDPDTWHRVKAHTNTSNPHEAVLAQALSAALMGHRAYALKVLTSGFYPLTDFPNLASGDLTVSYSDVREALALILTTATDPEQVLASLDDAVSNNLGE